MSDEWRLESCVNLLTCLFTCTISSHALYAALWLAVTYIDRQHDCQIDLGQLYYK